MDIKRFKEVKIKMIMKLRGISREEAARIEEMTTGDGESHDDTMKVGRLEGRTYPYIHPRMGSPAEFFEKL